MAPIPGGGVKKLGEGVLLVCVDDALIEQQDKNFSKAPDVPPRPRIPRFFWTANGRFAASLFCWQSGRSAASIFFFAGRTSKKNTVWLRKSQLTP
jgi:hypothetical protein